MPVTAYIFWLGIAEILFYVSGFIVHSVAGRILGPTEYGTYGIIITLTILIASLIGNGIPIAMSKFLSANLTKKPDLISIIKQKSAIAQLILMAIITAIFYFGAPLIARMLHDPSLTRLLKISAFIIPCYGADSFYFYYYTGIHKFNMQSILKSLRAVLRVAIIVGLGYFLSLEGFITGYIYVSFTVFLIALIIDKIIYAKRFPNKKITESFPIKKILSYALPITGFLVLYQTLISLDLFVVKSILRDDIATGLFNGAFTISQIPNYLFYALTIILLPVISHSTANEHKQKTNEAIALAFRMMTLLLVPVIALIIGYAKPLMVFFFGPQYAPGASALQFMAFGVGLLTLFYVMSFAFQGAGKVIIPLKIAFFAMFVNGVLNLLLVNKTLGLIGAGIATSITAVLVTLVLFYYLKKEFAVSLKISSLTKIIFSGLLIFLFSFLLPGKGLLFIISGGFLFLVYFGILYLLKEIDQQDLKLIVSMLPGKRKQISA
ncbi:MAG: oligosaccharide flippase family protein [Candidatus Moranbacteria bacterium]|nr:oligosaccharide flippase family protein [Candidatus Moranbacteria bacterium]